MRYNIRSTLVSISFQRYAFLMIIRRINIPPRSLLFFLFLFQANLLPHQQYAQCHMTNNTKSSTYLKTQPRLRNVIRILHVITALYKWIINSI